jgi:elongation factor Ts
VFDFYSLGNFVFDRDANEGVVIAITNDDNTTGVVVRLGCETDFVAKNEDFINLAKGFADIAITNKPATLEAFLALPYENITVGEKVIEQVGVIGEKVEISSYEIIEAQMVTPYIHAGYKAGVIVSFNKSSEDYTTAGKDVAMQVAAMSPIAVNEEGVDSTTIEKEIEIGKEQARAEGKPEAMLERIAEGKLKKFFKERTLLNQVFVKNSKQTIASYLQSVEKELTVNHIKHKVTLCLILRPVLQGSCGMGLM